MLLIVNILRVAEIFSAAKIFGYITLIWQLSKLLKSQTTGYDDRIDFWIYSNQLNSTAWFHYKFQMPNRHYIIIAEECCT